MELTLEMVINLSKKIHLGAFRFTASISSYSLLVKSHCPFRAQKLLISLTIDVKDVFSVQ